jgi:acetamidase/formamidase/pimeloyl-ACP methyl ester carboxylesterase
VSIWTKVRSFPRPRPAAVLAATAMLGTAAGARAQSVHHLAATPSTVAWGYYWAEAKPVLHVRSGDIVEVETVITSSPSRLEGAGVAPADIQPSLRAIYDSVTDRGPGGHILTGPIYVEGAEPGDVLEVKVLSTSLPIAYGYNGCSGFVREHCAREGGMRVLPLDREHMVSRFAPGITIPLRPFFGSMGVAPPSSEGRVSSTPPGKHAGNLDNRELVAGTSLFSPVHVPGALFEIGDGHAAQGDGEVDQTAIETSLDGRVQLTVHKGHTLEWPRAETPTDYIAMGTDEDLTTATKTAIGQAIEFLEDEKGLSEMEAYRLVSLACSVRITELVDGKMGVHVMIPKSIFTGGSESAGGAAEPETPSSGRPGDLSEVTPTGAAPVRLTVDSDHHPMALWMKRPEEPRAAILLLHGRTWSALPDFDLQVPGESLSLMDDLARRGFAVYALDQRGYGETPRDDTGWMTPDRAAADAANVLRWIEGREGGLPVDLLGWSLGSMTAQLTAERHPELVHRLVLYGYPFRPGAAVPAQGDPGDPPRRATTAQAAASDFITPGSISRAALDAYVKAALSADPVRADWAHSEQWNALDPAAVTVPTLVIRGERDPLAPQEANEALFGGLGTMDRALVVIPGGDHAVLLEKPRGYFLAALESFLVRDGS